jgi:hypothetical protein
MTNPMVDSEIHRRFLTERENRTHRGENSRCQGCGKPRPTDSRKDSEPLKVLCKSCRLARFAASTASDVLGYYSL